MVSKILEKFTATPISKITMNKLKTEKLNVEDLSKMPICCRITAGVVKKDLEQKHQEECNKCKMNCIICKGDMEKKHQEQIKNIFKKLENKHFINPFRSEEYTKYKASKFYPNQRRR